MKEALRLTLCAFIIAAVFDTRSDAADYTITVKCGQVKQQTGLMQGFLHGYGIDQTPDPELIGNNLAPRCWRLGMSGWQRYPQAAQFNPSITMNVADLYADAEGGMSNAKPWENWRKWEQFCADQARLCLANQWRVDYWDIWTEPDTSAMWKGTWPQLLETYKRGYDAIKGVDPAAKFVGPGTTEFAHPFDCDTTKRVNDFIYELSRPPYNVRMDAVSWHELGAMPSTMPIHADMMRSFLADPAYFSPPYAAELHVNEYGAPSTVQIPAWTVGWLYYAEEAKIDWLSRACWTMWEDSWWPFGQAWSNCTQGLEGLFMRDLKTPQQVYFVYWAYASINAETRIAATSNHADVSGLASKNDADQCVTVLAGLYNRPFKSSVEVVVESFPYQTTTANVMIAKFANNNELDSKGNPKAQPGQGPEATYSGVVAVDDATVRTLIEPYRDGDMYYIVFSAAPDAKDAETAHWKEVLSGMQSVVGK